MTTSPDASGKQRHPGLPELRKWTVLFIAIASVVAHIVAIVWIALHLAGIV